MADHDNNKSGYCKAEIVVTILSISTCILMRVKVGLGTINK